MKVNVSQYDAPSIQKGQKAQITGDALGDASYNGEVIKVAPAATKIVRNGNEEMVVAVEIEVKDKQAELKPGYSVDVDITTKEKKDVVVVPIISVLKEKDGKQIVYIVSKEFKVEKREVQVGAYSDLYMEVSGIKEGEQIVINPDASIKEGMFVKPQEKAGAEGKK